MLKNITEKYIKSVEKSIFKWKKTIRTITAKDLEQIPMTFKIPNHIANREEISITNYIIEKKEWNDLNQRIKPLISNEIIPENERIALNIIRINKKYNTSIEDMERFVIPSEKKEKPGREGRLTTLYITDKSKIYNNLLNINYANMPNNLRKDYDFTKEEIDDFKQTITSLLKNKPAPIDSCLNAIHYNTGRDILSKLLYKKGFKVVKQLKEESFYPLSKICINALISLDKTEENENQNILDFVVKITSAAFCYCVAKKGKTVQYNFLIDELRKSLGPDYIFWKKKSFWNTWQHLENYYTISDYGLYCQVVIHDFVNKLLGLKLDKDFIANYLVSSLGEKMVLLEHSAEMSEEEIRENQKIFMERREEAIELINAFPYE